jgi:hypothetical protein
MHIMTEIEVLDVEVNLGPDGITFSGPGISDNEIHVRLAMALIRFQLILKEGTQGSFPTYPIQWCADKQPTEQPAFCTVRRVGPQHCLMEIINSVQSEVSKTFTVLVQDGYGFIIGDPTVLNLPPGGGDTKKV